MLAGPDDLNVEVAEGGCIFEFDYSKVYWNSKLETEHRRLVNLFQPGEVVCDVMAGIGPFAVPAGKKRVFVWANDKNPESFQSLKAAIKNNKVSTHFLLDAVYRPTHLPACPAAHTLLLQVGSFVRPFCEDGRAFIHQAADSVLEASQKGEHAIVTRKAKPQPGKRKDIRSAVQHERIPLPPTISHFVMNLPATAIEFLGSYRGIYAGREALFAPHTAVQLPLVHVHCFSYKADDETPGRDICERIARELGVDAVRPGDDPDVEGQVVIHNVRDVAPAKSMYCASFRLPREVAFAARD